MHNILARLTGEQQQSSQTFIIAPYQARPLYEQKYYRKLSPADIIANFLSSNLSFQDILA